MNASNPDAHVPHGESAHEAANGEGTISHSRHGETLDHPVLDGSTESYVAEAEEQNPRRGMEDPGLIRHPETGEKTPTPNEEA